MERKEWIIEEAKRFGVRYIPNYVLGIIRGIVGTEGYCYYTAEEIVKEIRSTLKEMSEVEQDKSLPWDTSRPVITEGVGENSEVSSSHVKYRDTVPWEPEDITLLRRSWPKENESSPAPSDVGPCSSD